MSVGSTTKISKRVEKELHQTKVVIRRLPPDFTEEKFLETVNPLPSNSYFYFAPGDSTLGPHGCCRAYVAFDIEAEILPFRDRYDGLVLESEKGNKYRMTVEYAPFQGLPKKSRRKPDARVGTIDQDVDYKAFLEAYEAAEEPAQALDLVGYLQHLEATKPKVVQSTPLTEYLDRRSAKMKRGRGDPKKKSKGESSKSKSKGSKEETKSAKASDESSRDSKRKERGRREKPEPPRLATKEKVDEEASSKSATQWSIIEPSTSTEDSKTKDKDTRKSSGRADGISRSHDDRGEGRTRNRNRPDRAIYTPRRQSYDDSGKSEGSGKYREGSGRGGRSQRYRGGRDEGEYWQRDDRQSGRSRDRGRSSRDRPKQGNDFRNES